MDTQPDNASPRPMDQVLHDFLRLNEYSKLVRTNDAWRVDLPWNDDSLCVLLGQSPAPELAEALNALILPPRFTALYHTDTGSAEFIFTVLPRGHAYSERKFKFTLDGTTYECWFGPASERLRILCQATVPVKQVSSTAYRNLMMLRTYWDAAQGGRSPEEAEFVLPGEPRSFWVAGIPDWNEDRLVEISRHLNFLMLYFDRNTPRILIHPLKMPSEDTDVRIGQPDFPPVLAMTSRNALLLDLALAAHEAEARLAYIYYYQILEYAAFYYIESDVMSKMRQVICQPDVLADTTRCARLLLDVFAEQKQDEVARQNKLMQTACPCEKVWPIIQRYSSYFTQAQAFDGGFLIGPLLPSGCSYEHFSGMWIPSVPGAVRKVRNALVHSRDHHTGGHIAPTKRNDALLKPYLLLVRCMAEQVILTTEAG